MKSYPQKVKIVEVGARDGLQNESQVISLEDKLEFIKLLAASGLKNIEVGAFVSPKHLPQMADTDKLFLALTESKTNYSGTGFACLVPNMKGLERAIESGTKDIAVFTAASETFVTKNINMSIDESLKVFKEVIDEALKNKISVRGYISTCFVCPYEGEIKKEKVYELTKSLFDMGVREVSLGDTIGAAAPSDVHNLLEHANWDITKIALHMHDTYGTALANVSAGLEHGIAIFDSSCGGLGGCPYAPGASGNLATEDLVYMLERMGIETGVNLGELVKAAKFIDSKLGKVLPSKNLRRLS